MAVFMTAWFFYGSLWILRSLILVNCEGKPKFRFEPKKNYVAHVERSIRLRCPVSGTEDPEHNRTLVVWYKNGSLIHITQVRWSRFLLLNKKHLKIIEIQKEDAGTYKCKAINSHGTTFLNIVLKVKAGKKSERGKPPKFKQFPKTRKMYKTGETVKLQCHCSGKPDPLVRWFKNGIPYRQESRRTSIGAHGMTLNLRYLDVDDTGNYTCRVRNNVGSINRTFEVIVKARTLKPIIDEPDVVRRTTREGRSVKLYCKVTSVGQVTFNWRWSERNSNKTVDLKHSHRTGSKYIWNHTKTRVVSMNRFYFDGFLEIKDVRKQDEGIYSCMVKNTHGKDKVDFYLRVREKVDQTLPTTPNPTVTAATKLNLHATEKTISVMFVAVLTVAIVVIMIFIVVLIMCCRKQRKDLEKQYVNEYQPQNFYQPYAQQISVTQEMQKSEKDYPISKINENETEPIKACASLQSFQNSLKNSKQDPSSSSEIYLANSRTSLQTTLCRTCPRETSFDCNGSTNHSLPRKTESWVQSKISCGLPFSASALDGNVERQNWESKISLDDSPRNTSPQRSRESIV